MCYYSKSMRAGTFREATPADDIIMRSDSNGHSFGVDKNTGMILCLRQETEAHIVSLRVRAEHVQAFTREYPTLAVLIGQPVSGYFREMGGSEHSNDSFRMFGRLVPFGFFADGMEFYIGAKRPTLESKLGTDDPSIALDHNTDTPAREVERV